MKLIRIYILLFFFITSCQTLDDVGKVMTNEKIKTTDEFLVEKKDPLIIPPNANELPEPGSKILKKTDNPIQKILKTDNTSSQNSSKTSTTEQSVINQIRK